MQEFIKLTARNTDSEEVIRITNIHDFVEDEDGCRVNFYPKKQKGSFRLQGFYLNEGIEEIYALNEIKRDFIKVTYLNQKFLLRKSEISHVQGEGFGYQGGMIFFYTRQRLKGFGYDNFLPIRESAEEIYAMLNERDYSVKSKVIERISEAIKEGE